MALIKEHSDNIMFTSSEYINDICKPLFEDSSLTYFNYVKVYHDLSHVTLTTNTEWLTYLLTHELDKHITFEKNIYYDEQFLIWDDSNKNDMIKIAERDKFNIDNGITYVKPLIHATEYFYFATTPDNRNIINYYANKLDNLKDFSTYFKDQASLLLQVADQNRIMRNK